MLKRPFLSSAAWFSCQFPSRAATLHSGAAQGWMKHPGLSSHPFHAASEAALTVGLPSHCPPQGNGKLQKMLLTQYQSNWAQQGEPRDGVINKLLWRFFRK